MCGRRRRRGWKGAVGNADPADVLNGRLIHAHVPARPGVHFSSHAYVVVAERLDLWSFRDIHPYAILEKAMLNIVLVETKDPPFKLEVQVADDKD